MQYVADLVQTNKRSTSPLWLPNLNHDEAERPELWNNKSAFIHNARASCSTSPTTHAADHSHDLPAKWLCCILHVQWLPQFGKAEALSLQTANAAKIKVIDQTQVTLCFTNYRVSAIFNRSVIIPSAVMQWKTNNEDLNWTVHASVSIQLTKCKLEKLAFSSFGQLCAGGRQLFHIITQWPMMEAFGFSKHSKNFTPIANKLGNLPLALSTTYHPILHLFKLFIIGEDEAYV